jgi:hypothetical protein
MNFWIEIEITKTIGIVKEEKENCESEKELLQWKSLNFIVFVIIIPLSSNISKWTKY